MVERMSSAPESFWYFDDILTLNIVLEHYIFLYRAARMASIDCRNKGDGYAGQGMRSTPLHERIFLSEEPLI